jgi:hypothetical protein
MAPEHFEKQPLPGRNGVPRLPTIPDLSPLAHGFPETFVTHVLTTEQRRSVPGKYDLSGLAAFSGVS